MKTHIYITHESLILSTTKHANNNKMTKKKKDKNLNVHIAMKCLYGNGPIVWASHNNYAAILLDTTGSQVESVCNALIELLKIARI